jgi:hypothetical protein
MNRPFSFLVRRIISTMMSARTRHRRFPRSLHTSACVLPLASKGGKWAAFSCRLLWRSQRSRSRSCSICTLSTRVQALPAQVSPWSEMKLGWPTGVQMARRPSLPCQIPRARHLSSGFVILGVGSTFFLAGLEAVRGCEDNEVLEGSDVLLRLPYMKLSSA